MLRAAIALFILALIAAGFGYTGIAAVMFTAVRKASWVVNMKTAGGAWAKAAELGLYTVNWKNMLATVPQGIAGGYGIILFAFVAAYVFGREYRDGTSSNLLTVPVRREYVVIAKLLVVWCWTATLAVLAVLLYCGLLAAYGVDGFAWAHVARTVRDSLLVTFIFFLTLPLVAWMAAAGRGYLRPMLFSFAVMAISNGVATTSVSRYFPWNMGIHVVGASWMPIVSDKLNALSWVIAVSMFAIGLFGVLRHVDVADAAG